MITDPDVLARLRRAIDAAGTQAEFCRAAGISRGHLVAVLGGRRKVGAKLRLALGLEPKISDDVALGAAPAGCHDCGRPYGSQYGFPDLVVPHDVWNNYISPSHDPTGMLCPSCMCKRAYDAGLENVPAVFRSGPFAYQAFIDAEDARQAALGAAQTETGA